MVDSGYHVIEPIGEGSFGRVYKGRRKYTSEVDILNTYVNYACIYAQLVSRRLANTRIKVK